MEVSKRGVIVTANVAIRASCLLPCDQQAHRDEDGYTCLMKDWRLVWSLHSRAKNKPAVDGYKHPFAEGRAIQAQAISQVRQGIDQRLEGGTQNTDMVC